MYETQNCRALPDPDVPEPPRPDPPAHTIRASLNGAVSNGRWTNVFWIRNGAGTTPSDAELSSFATQMYQKWVTHFNSVVCVPVILEGCQVIYYGGGGLQIGADHIENTPGAMADTELPANVSACITWFVQQRYRGGHPRTYLPPPDRAALLNSTDWTPTFVDNVRTRADGFHVDVNAMQAGVIQDCHLGTVSFVHQKKWRDPPVFRDFTPAAAKVDTRIDSMRRRLGRDR